MTQRKKTHLNIWLVTGSLSVRKKAKALQITTTNLAFCNVFLVTKEEFVVDLRRFLQKLSQHVVTYIFAMIKELSKKMSQKVANQENDIKYCRKLVHRIVLTNQICRRVCLLSTMNFLLPLRFMFSHMTIFYHHKFIVQNLVNTYLNSLIKTPITICFGPSKPTSGCYLKNIERGKKEVTKIEKKGKAA